MHSLLPPLSALAHEVHELRLVARIRKMVDIVFGVRLDVVLQLHARLGHLLVLAAGAVGMCRPLEVVDALIEVAEECT